MCTAAVQLNSHEWGVFDVCACAVAAIRRIEGVMGRECSDMLWDVATVTGSEGTWQGLWADGG